MADVRPVPDVESRWAFWFRCDWVDLFSRCNWYTITLLRLEIENESFLGNVNWTIGLLGFVWGGSYCYERTEAMSYCKRYVDGLSSDAPRVGLCSESDTPKEKSDGN